MDNDQVNIYVEKDEDVTYTYNTIGPTFESRTKKAWIELVQTKEFGNCLYMDGQLQLASADEYIYHEMLVHPTLSFAESRKNVCIIGGGDSCAAREIMKWSDVDKIVCIDWDEEFVDLVKQGFLGVSSKRCANDKTIYFEHVDIQSILDEKRQYDIILLDLVDPKYTKKEDVLFWNNLLKKLSNWLAPKGILTMNGGGFTQQDSSVQEWLVRACLFEMGSLKKHELLLYKIFVPSFRREWCFFMIRPIDTLESDRIDLVEQNKISTRYFNEAAWLLSKTWTKDYMGILPSGPQNLSRYSRV